MNKLQCDPLEVRRTPRPGLPDRVEWRCSQCGFSDTDEHGQFPDRLHRTCGVQHPPPLTALGQALDSLPPGDGLARLAGRLGAKRLAAEWERVSRLPCGCVDRQIWLNQRWRQFVWKHFRADRAPWWTRLLPFRPGRGQQSA